MSKSTRTEDEEEQPLILVVDDFEDGREMYASYLRFSGYRVDEAADGQEALDKAFELLPDIILMDLSLPVKDGWQATRELKKDARTAKIPIVALTGHALEAHSRSAKEAGCDAFIVKPCMPMDLLNEIRRILDNSAKKKDD
ncbi:MAG: response regulator [Polyangiaceae bacterium]|nr:response regulator [Polyangiaceae bacterium]NUQ76469.1 response regulator [Polyangiaceae bacterium]